MLTDKDRSHSESAEPIVFVVEDDDDMRISLHETLTKASLNTKCFRVPSEFLEYYKCSMGGCLVVDFQLPEINGLQLYDRLAEMKYTLPFIVISGFANVSRVRDAFRQGAVDFLEKPFGRAELLEQVNVALEQDAENRQRQRERDTVAARLVLLTPREKELMNLLTDGWETKAIANKLGISRKTAHNHRAHILEKMKVDNVPRLVRLIQTVQ
ncbi:MAG: response regulator [Pirellulaceae bacterium]|nr:response regulator [Pirellulaceae bacterium]